MVGRSINRITGRVLADEPTALSSKSVITTARLLIVTSVFAVVGLFAPKPIAAQEPTGFETYAETVGLSQEHADVFRLYWAFFEREPDVAGSTYWVKQYDSCNTILDITWAFAASTEFESTNGELTDREFVTLVYNNVLGRRPEADGYDYWIGLLDSETLTRPEVMLYFSLSDEFRTKRPLPSDGTPYSGCVAPASRSYANCTEVREAGHAPLYRGDAGYRSGLDRDGDGIACEV